MIILIFIIPVIFVLVGIGGIVKLIIAKKKCTEYVDAAVVERLGGEHALYRCLTEGAFGVAGRRTLDEHTCRTLVDVVLVTHPIASHEGSYCCAKN